MITVVIVIHLMLAVGLIGVVLVQKSEGGALGMGSGGMSGFMSGRSAANLLTRTTAILAACFFATSIALARLASAQRTGHTVIDTGPAPAQGPGRARRLPARPRRRYPRCRPRRRPPPRRWRIRTSKKIYHGDTEPTEEGTSRAPSSKAQERAVILLGVLRASVV